MESFLEKRVCSGKKRVHRVKKSDIFCCNLYKCEVISNEKNSISNSFVRNVRKNFF